MIGRPPQWLLDRLTYYPSKLLVSMYPVGVSLQGASLWEQMQAVKSGCTIAVETGSALAGDQVTKAPVRTNTHYKSHISALKSASACPQVQSQVAFVQGVRTGRGALLLAVFRGKV